MDTPTLSISPTMSTFSIKPSGYTPVPNALLDDLLPRLKDTELRLLLVVMRQTLGWHGSTPGQRKERDWLTQRQLIARTGCATASLSRAIDSLVQQGLLQVCDDAGLPLSTPAQRRKHRGRLWFAVGPAFLLKQNPDATTGEEADQASLDATGIPAKRELVSSQRKHAQSEYIKDQNTKSEYEASAASFWPLKRELVSSSNTFSPADTTHPDQGGRDQGIGETVISELASVNSELVRTKSEYVPSISEYAKANTTKARKDKIRAEAGEPFRSSPASATGHIHFLHSTPTSQPQPALSSQLLPFPSVSQPDALEQQMAARQARLEQMERESTGKHWHWDKQAERWVRDPREAQEDVISLPHQ